MIIRRFTLYLLCFLKTMIYYIYFQSRRLFIFRVVYIWQLLWQLECCQSENMTLLKENTVVFWLWVLTVGSWSNWIYILDKLYFFASQINSCIVSHCVRHSSKLTVQVTTNIYNKFLCFLFHFSRNFCGSPRRIIWYWQNGRNPAVYY